MTFDEMVASVVDRVTWRIKLDYWGDYVRTRRVDGEGLDFAGPVEYSTNCPMDGETEDPLFHWAPLAEVMQAYGELCAERARAEAEGVCAAAAAEWTEDKKRKEGLGHSSMAQWYWAQACAAGSLAKKVRQLNESAEQNAEPSEGVAEEDSAKPVEQVRRALGENWPSARLQRLLEEMEGDDC